MEFAFLSNSDIMIEPRYLQVPVNPYNPKEGTKNGEQEHLYVKTLFIGGNDTIENYVEVDKPKE